MLPKAGDKAGDKEYTLRPKSGATIGGGTSAKLSYSKACSSSSTKLSSKGLMSWTVRYAYRPDGKSSYTIGAARKPTQSKRGGQCAMLLGCSSSSKEGRGASPALLSGSPRSPATAWMLRFVRAIRQPSSPSASAPPPPPPPVVLIEVVSITLGIADETVESFGQAKQDALCSTIVAASGDPTAECRVTSVVPKGDGGRRRVMQAGGDGGSGIDVDTRTTFVTVVTDTSGGGGGSTGGSTGGRRGPDAGAIRAGAIRAGAIRAGAIRADSQPHAQPDAQPHADPDDIKCWNDHHVDDVSGECGCDCVGQKFGGHDNRVPGDEHRRDVDRGHRQQPGRHGHQHVLRGMRGPRRRNVPDGGDLQ